MKDGAAPFVSFLEQLARGRLVERALIAATVREGSNATTTTGSTDTATNVVARCIAVSAISTTAPATSSNSTAAKSNIKDS